MGQNPRKDRKPEERIVFTKPFPIVLRAFNGEIYLILKDDMFFVLPTGEASKVFSFLNQYFKWLDYKHIRRNTLFPLAKRGSRKRSEGEAW